MREHLDEIIVKIRTLTPFALIRPSDGEYSILKGNTLTNCDNWTFKSGGILQGQLMKSIQTFHPSVYIGIPCNTCNRGWNCTEEIYNDFINKYNVPLQQTTYANIFMNSTWSHFVSFMTSFTYGFYYIGSGTLTGSLTIKDRLLVDSKLVDTWDTSHTNATARVLDFIKDKSKQVFCIDFYHFLILSSFKVYAYEYISVSVLKHYFDAGIGIVCYVHSLIGLAGNTITKKDVDTQCEGIFFK
jgi:hypothetical protein